ncbi:hypothetical protein Mp_2g25630 [Marchantia polymorpha subsp. ruderalis]|uniref:Uncharacterized protein n=1 Tax=Marchantia polymorpha TaxID=3197 RepID=A0A2R6XBE1_MARPO|nr:hypothetical protein MARPO_0025s0115 [Marchantia polymorpha]BBN03699.1 hypothetical protein Mp_2g25630 [Marchantia polymorpha subsp. ruderalis]|eukprot:PTQ43433.1 hypothetical protein MARPO_0025s0115 [Marchantia polymorpha]
MLFSRVLCSACCDANGAEAPKCQSAVSKSISSIDNQQANMDETGKAQEQGRRGSKTPTDSSNPTPPTSDPNPLDSNLTEEQRAEESLLWQQALSESLAKVAECIHAIPPGLEHMDSSLSQTLQTVADECRNAIPRRAGTKGLDSPTGSPYTKSDIVEIRLTELESKFHLLYAYAKSNAHAIARAYNRSCVRLSDLLCPLLDKEEMVPPDFPDTLGQFQQLPGEAVIRLLASYRVPEIPESDEERRIDLARYIGVNI